MSNEIKTKRLTTIGNLFKVPFVTKGKGLITSKKTKSNGATEEETLRLMDKVENFDSLQP